MAHYNLMGLISFVLIAAVMVVIVRTVMERGQSSLTTNELLIQKKKFDINSARKLLEAANVFFDVDDEVPPQTLNLNDALNYACADGETVMDGELPRLAELFWQYGWCGILYWVSVEKRGGELASIPSVQRKIDFIKETEGGKRWKEMRH